MIMIMIKTLLKITPTCFFIHKTVTPTKSMQLTNLLYVCYPKKRLKAIYLSCHSFKYQKATS